MPRTLLSNMAAKAESQEALEEAYQCHSFEDIAKCFALIHTELTNNLAAVVNEVRSIKTKVADLENKQDRLRCDLDTTKSFLKSDIESARSESSGKLDARAKLIETELKTLTDNLTKLNIWGRKWNLVFKGIPGSLNETSSATKKVIKNFLVNDLKMPKDTVDSIQFGAAHRLPGGREGKKNIIVRFVDLVDRDLVLNSTRNLSRGSNMAVMTDLPPEIAKRRSELLGKRFEMPVDQRKHYRVKQLKEAPFVVLSHFNPA